MDDWPVTLGVAGVFVTAVVGMISLAPGVILGLVVMWAILFWIFARAEDKRGR